VTCDNCLRSGLQTFTQPHFDTSAIVGIASAR
jgi:hypothetical protein